jgi:hypothetical protein
MGQGWHAGGTGLGPVALLCERMGIDPGPIEPLYAPVMWLHDNTPLEQPIEWYVGLWGVK